MGSLNLEAAALRAVEAQFGWKLTRHRADLFSKMQKFYGRGSGTYVKDFFLREIVPDGWAMIETEEDISIIAVEVEDTHKLSHEKLLAYGIMWEQFDSSDELNFYLLAVDRYGQQPRWFNLPLLFFLALAARTPNAKRREQLTQEASEMFGPIILDFNPLEVTAAEGLR